MNKKNGNKKDVVYKIKDGNNRTQPYIQIMVALADMMDKETLAIYYELKSTMKMDGDTLSNRQLQKAWNMSPNTIKDRLNMLKEEGVIEIIKTAGRNVPNEIILKDVDKAWEINPEGKNYKRGWRWTLDT